MQHLEISDASVRIDQEGRYCLNDLHRAAMRRGKAQISHKPSNFLRLPGTIKLINALKERCSPASIDPVASSKGGAKNQQGTFVEKTLVYSYAMWVDAHFAIEVIETFDKVKNPESGLWLQMQALVAKEVSSQVKASFGSHLMLQRKKEIPPLRTEREILEAAIQPSLLN